MQKRPYLKKGARVGKWTVISAPFRDSGKNVCYTCECDCGTIKVKTASSLYNNKSNRCKRCSGISRRKLPVVGETYGNWTVLKIMEETGGKGTIAICECKCGALKKVPGFRLYGKTKQRMCSKCPAYSVGNSKGRKKRRNDWLYQGVSLEDDKKEI